MKKALLLTSTMTVLALASCGNKDKVENVREIAYNGDTYEVTSDIKKAVVMDLGFLDIMDDLKVEVDVAIPDSTLPSYLSEYENNTKVGGLKTPNEEEIVKFEPDVIILGGRQSSYVEAFNKIAPTILLSQNADEDAVEYVYKNLELAADLFNLSEDVLTSKKTAVEEKIAETKALTSTSEDKALILLYNNSFSAYGSGSRFGIIHDVLGVKEADETIDVSTHGQQMSPEQLIALNPDRLFVVDRTVVVNGEEDSDLFKNSIYDNLAAKKNNKITYLDSVIWYTIGGGYQATFNQIQEIYNAYK